MSIKSKANNIKIILFVVIYSAACFITSKNIEGNIFYYNSLNFQLLKSAAVFILVFLVTIINRKNIEKINNYASIYIAAAGIIYFADNYTLHFSGSLAFFRLITSGNCGYWVWPSDSLQPKFSQRAPLTSTVKSDRKPRLPPRLYMELSLIYGKV